MRFYCEVMLNDKKEFHPQRLCVRALSHRHAVKKVAKYYSGQHGTVSPRLGVEVAHHSDYRMVKVQA